ncbi:MAG: hypothetical protein PHC75_03805 [Burkholderiales bacterium]|nr:hypothetical protein [Burkholderiales bacterium]
MICLRHNTNMKFYLLWVEEDLLGEWSFCKLTGSGRKSERKLSICCNNHIEANQMLNDLEYQLRQKGFVYFDGIDDMTYNYNIS